MAYIKPTEIIVNGRGLTSSASSATGISPVTLNVNTATTATLGIIQVGSGLSITPDGLYYTVLSTININWKTVSTPLPTNQPNYSLTIDNFNIQLINTNLDVYVVSSTNTPYKWKVANTSQSLLGTYRLLVQSHLYSIYGFYDITFIQPTQAEYGLLENKKLGVAPCSSVSLTPALARATTNNICITNKKNKQQSYNHFN